MIVPRAGTIDNQCRRSAAAPTATLRSALPACPAQWCSASSSASLMVFEKINIAVLRYIDHYSSSACRMRRPLPAECRPKFISVAAWEARFRQCSPSSIRFSLCENCYNPLQPAQAGFAFHSRGLMVVEQIIRHSPRRRASPSIAEGFSPTARRVERIKCSISMSTTARGAYRIKCSISTSPTARGRVLVHILNFHTGSRFLGKPQHSLSRFRHQDAQTPPSPTRGEGSRGDEGQKRTGALHQRAKLSRYTHRTTQSRTVRTPRRSRLSSRAASR